MKHLKTINELYINTSEVSSVIDDILLEINDIPKFTSLNWGVDDGMVVIVKLSENDDYMEEGVNISGDIKETIKRLLDFMNNSGYEYLMEFGTDNIPPGTPQKELSDYIRKFEYKELDDNDLTMWMDEFIRITFTK
jgi:hypothetical protein